MAIKNPYAGAFNGGADAASLGAANADFFGEGLDTSQNAKAPEHAPLDPAASTAAINARNATQTANINAVQDRTSGTGAPLASGGGATGAYDAGNDTGRANYNYMHDLGSAGAFGSVRDAFNQLGESVGVSHAGDVSNPANNLNFAAPWDVDPTGGTLDANHGLGFTGVDLPGGASGGRPIANMTPGTRAAADIASSGTHAGDALEQAMGGLGGGPDIPIDASGNDRGSMGLNGAYSDTLANTNAQADADRSLGQGVLNGTVAPGGAGTAGQQDALDQAMSFASGPRKANDVMTDVNGFLSAPQGPSAAELQLQQGAQGNMADALSLARSGRARDAGSQARMLSQALANNAATGVDTARDTALLRAKEASDAKAQQLQALGLKGNLAQGLDADTLKALGLGGDLATQLRSGNITERGQSLNYDQGQNQIGASQDSDVLKAIPQLETIRHSDQFDLTPQQKLAAAKIGGAPDKTTADYVTGLLGDVLSAL